VQASLQGALSEGLLDLPPCTSIDEWHAFRAGLNELLYTRFGVTVQDCYPIDLHPATDLAAILRARRTASAPTVAAPPATASTAAATESVVAPDPGTSGSAVELDKPALRRLFLELPALSAAMRMLTPPEGGFAAQQELLQRLALVALDVNTMPSLAWETPDRQLPRALQESRAGFSVQAVSALDDAWALLARLKLAASEELTQLYDEADRLVANLEFALANRRAVPSSATGDEIAPHERREPSLGTQQ